MYPHPKQGLEKVVCQLTERAAPRLGDWVSPASWAGGLSAQCHKLLCYDKLQITDYRLQIKPTTPN